MDSMVLQQNKTTTLSGLSSEILIGENDFRYFTRRKT